MKKGICSFAFPGHMSFSEIFVQAKEFGFDGVELCLCENGELNPNVTDDKLARIMELAKKAEIELYSVTTSLYWSASLVSDDEAERNLALSYAKKQIDVAKKLGCESVLIVPGHTGVSFAPDLGVIEYDVAYERAVQSAKVIASYAQDAGIVAGMENVWNKFLLSPLEMKGFIDEINNPCVKAYFDVGNVLVNGYPEHWIKILGSRIDKIHLKDFKLDTNSFCDLLSGDVNYPAVMKALKNTGYNGWLTAEYVPYSTDNTVMLRHISNAIDSIINF